MQTWKMSRGSGKERCRLSNCLKDFKRNFQWFLGICGFRWHGPLKDSEKSNTFVCLFFVILGSKLRAYSLNHSKALFCDFFFFEIGSLKLFAWAGFEPQYS
jgi:hypothetical protein